MAGPAPIRSVPDFLAAVEKMTPLEKTHIRLYRGQSGKWPMLPGLFRKPNSVGLVRKVESELLSRLKKEVPHFVPSRPENDWDWLSFGQHFGLRTRLLDWTKTPLMALFFAVEQNSTAPVVYVYHAMRSQIVTAEDKLNKSPFDIPIIRILDPSPHSTRVMLQQGWHTVDKIRRGKNGQVVFIPLKNMDWHDHRIKSVPVDPLSTSIIRGQLAKTGIKHSTVYGEFVPVCSSICSALGVT